MPVSAGDILRIVARMSFNANDVVNTYHARVVSGSAADDGTLVASAAEIIEDAYDTINSKLSNGLSYMDITVYNLTEDRLMGVVDWPALTAGGDAGTVLPEQVAALVRFGTNQLRSQGRKFLGMFTESDWSGVTGWSGDLRTALAAFGAALLGELVNGTLAIEMGNWRDEPARFVEWVSAIVNNKARIQRRRTPGRGT